MIRLNWLLTIAAFCIVAEACLAADPANSKSTPAPSKEPDKPARITSQTAVEPLATLTEKESREVSFAAGRVLKHVAQARAALAEQKNDQAQAHIEKAVTLVKIIDGVLPHFKMKTTISAGDLVYSDEDEVAPALIPVYEELERRDIVSPVLRAKSEAAQKSDRQSSGKQESAESAGKSPMYVSHSDLDYTALKLDVDLTRRLLHQAKQAFSQKDAKQADQLLAGIQAAVIFEYDEVDLPLAQAADNLKLAEAEMKVGRYDASKAALQAAVNELEKYEKQTGETRGKEVTALHKEIRELTAELDKGKPSAADAERHASRISGWWDRARAWFKSK